jgi:DNA-binding transcriptional regulator YdaS (Cro superfamily)
MAFSRSAALDAAIGFPSVSHARAVAAIAFALALTVAPTVAASAPAQPAGPAASLPPVPATRVLAIGRLTGKATPEALRAVMPQEVRDTVRLYLSGQIVEWFVRKDQAGVVFILSASDPKAARQTLEALPLGQAGLMDFDLIPLGPLAPLGLLLTPDAQ